MKWKLDYYSASLAVHSTEKVKLICLLMINSRKSEFILFFIISSNFSQQFGEKKLKQVEGAFRGKAVSILCHFGGFINNSKLNAQ